VSAVPGTETAPRNPAVDVLTGFLAAAAIFLGGFALFLGIFVTDYRPVRMTVPAMALALAAVALGGRYARLAAVAVGFSALGFCGGLIVHIFLDKPIF